MIALGCWNTSCWCVRAWDDHHSEQSKAQVDLMVTIKRACLLECLSEWTTCGSTWKYSDQTMTMLESKKIPHIWNHGKGTKTPLSKTLFVLSSRKRGSISDTKKKHHHFLELQMAFKCYIFDVFLPFFAFLDFPKRQKQRKTQWCFLDVFLPLVT